jgi:hypothetical protein
MFDTTHISLTQAEKHLASWHSGQHCCPLTLSCTWCGDALQTKGGTDFKPARGKAVKDLHCLSCAVPYCLCHVTSSTEQKLEVHLDTRIAMFWYNTCNRLVSLNRPAVW